MRNLAAKVPEDLWPDFKARATAAYYHAPSRKIARDLAEGLVRDYESLLPSVVTCFMDDFEACIAHLRLPVTHRRATRTTDVIDKDISQWFLRCWAVLGRPRGKERVGSWKIRRAA